MSSDKQSADDIIQAAVEQLADRDPALSGGRASRWLLITEHKWPDSPDGHATLSVFTSGNQPSWVSLGLLRFATLHQEDRAMNWAGDADADED